MKKFINYGLEKKNGAWSSFELPDDVVDMLKEIQKDTGESYEKIIKDAIDIYCSASDEERECILGGDEEDE